ncbi:MAG TPA: ABC transporter permease [Gemmatimonadaceae bacterium]
MMRLYRALLFLYPASFRREYGAELHADFQARVRRTGGGFALAALWFNSVMDVIVNALAAHWDVLRHDLRYTARTLARSPGFALTAILVTALGIGANTAAFSVADFVLIRPLPFADPGRLVKLWERPVEYGRFELSPPNYRDYQAAQHSFAEMGAFHATSVNLVGRGDPQRLTGSALTAEVLPLLGVNPLIGRTFTAEEQHAAASGTVVLSYGLWQRGFGGDPSVLGQRLLLDGEPTLVIGVMPREFNFPTASTALWTLMPRFDQDNDERANNWFQVIARLKPGVTIDAARADMNVIAASLAQRYPNENAGIGATVNTIREELSSQSQLMLLALCGAAVCVLLIACANLANLLIARSLVRRRELDVRLALGAGRERLVRQLLTESLVIAALGGTLGVVIAASAVPLLSRLVPNSLPLAGAPSVDFRVLVVAGLVSALTGIGFGVLPALRASSGDLSGLREGARSGGGRRARLRSALVVFEVTASVVLLVSSGLLLRALSRVEGTDPGFRSSGVITLRTALPRPQYDSITVRERYYRQVLDGIRGVPGVQSAAYISFLPMTMTGGIFPIEAGGIPSNSGSARNASMRFSTPGFFGAMGIPLRAGRDLDESDEIGRPPVAVVSESFAKKYFPGENPIGRQFGIGLGGESRIEEIVGVVGDVRVRGLERTSEPQMYLSYKQQAGSSFPFFTPKDLVIRTDAPMAEVMPAVRRIIHEADPTQPVSDVRPLAELVSEQVAPRAVQVRVIAAFAAIAFFLAAVGIHGLLAFSVSTRSHEIGVRMALGAQQGAIVRLVVRQGAVLALCGVVPGVALAYAAGRAMQSLLFGIEPGDTATFAAAVSLCVLMTLAGTLLPAMRAVKVAPASVFRGE